MTQLFKAQEELILDATDDNDVITTSQYLGDDFFEDLKTAKEDFHIRLNGFTPVASIPEALVNKWIREGYDFANAPAKDIVAKLRLESYDQFVIAPDRTF